MKINLEKIIEIEKKKLGIPEDFSIKVYEKRSEPFIAGNCIPEVENGKLVGVRIKISEDINGLSYLNTLLHELYHAYEYWKFYASSKKYFSNTIEFWEEYEKRVKFSELRADLYALRRSLYYIFRKVFLDKNI